MKNKYSREIPPNQKQVKCICCLKPINSSRVHTAQWSFYSSSARKGRHGYLWPKKMHLHPECEEAYYFRWSNRYKTL